MSSLINPLRGLFKSIFGRWEDKPDNQQTYVKILFAVLSGIFCGLQGQTFAGTRGLAFGLLVYSLSLFVIVYLLEIDPEEIGGRQKLITAGLPTYLLLWVLLWTLIFAFTLPPEIIGDL
ncbi:MAG: hypothetical protein ACE5H4_01825 [Candidatus Thorarchaeota archaeon]